MRVVDIDFYKILLDRKSSENILTYDISYKTFMGSKPLRITFDKIDGFIKSYDGTRLSSSIIIFNDRMNQF